MTQLTATLHLRHLLVLKGTASIRYALQGGVDGYSVSRPDILGGYTLFDDAETIDVDYLLMGPSMTTLSDSIAKAQHIISIAASVRIAWHSSHLSEVT